MNPEVWRSSRWLPVAAALVAALAVWAALAAFVPRALVQFEERTGDFVWRSVAVQQDEHRLVIVDIDEKSLREVGPWPWPRETLARLSRKLAAQGVGLQAYDVVFPDVRPDNARLAAAFAETQPVLAQVFSFEAGSPQQGKLAGALDWPACPQPFPEARGFIANAPGLVPGMAGHITPRVAADGVIRHQPAVVCHQGAAYPALSVAAYLQASGAKSLTLQRGEGWLDAPWKLAGLPTPQAALPLDAQGDLRIPWALRTESFISLSAADVLNDRVPAQALRNAWVLVGSTAFGLADIIATPFSGASAGLQAHAQLLLGMLEGRVPTEPARAPFYKVLAALAGVLMLVALSMRKRISIYAVPALAIAWGLVLFALHAFMVARWNLWIGWLSPALFTVLAGAALSLFNQARMRFERNRLYTHLSSYLPEQVAASLALLPPSSAVNAARQDIVALYADIRNFSAYCEARPAEESAAILHAFYSCVTRIVEAEGGVVESFQGDAVLAVWQGESGPEAALRAGVKLLDESRGMLPDPAPEGLEPLALGIGIESGDALVGSFGLARRRAHLAMGRTVTVAIRLVGMTVDLAHPILVGEGLAARLTGAPLESMGTFLLEGMRTPHHIYAYPLAG